MTGERKNIYQDANYGNLNMRTFDIDGNEISAFYDAENNLVFVRDNTINAQKPNVLLVINPDGDKKWDEILSNEYSVDLETIRPKVDNKYQKLDIEYSGLSVYENLINAYNSGDDLEEHLNQLAILRDSAVRHSAMARLNAANETIAKTNTTIVKTKETIVHLESRIKTLRSNLSAEKKSIGKVNTKQSASKILKLESQIEATNEKLKRAKKRLDSAQKRLDAATADAELASTLLNQPSVEIKQKTKKNEPVMVAPKYPVQTIEEDEELDDEEDDGEDEVAEEEFTENDVKPLFSEDPQILNDNIAFKPIEFNAPTFSDELVEKEEAPLPVVEPEKTEAHLEVRPVLESFAPVQEPVFVPKSAPIIEEEKTEVVEERPVLETMKPIEEDVEMDVQVDETPTTEQEFVAPVVEQRPVAPVVPTGNNTVAVSTKSSKPGFVYYILLLVLIVLSIFTLWLYQKNMTTDTGPVLAAKSPEITVLKPATKKVADTPKVAEEEPVFLTDAPLTEKADKEIESDTDIEPVSDSETVDDTQVYSESVEPVVVDAVPGRLNTSGLDVVSEDELSTVSEEDVLATKPVYEPGAKYDNMFVSEGDYVEPDDEYSDYFYDEEEAAYQKENM